MTSPLDHNVFSTSTALRIAQVLGLTSTAFFCGKTYSQSFNSTPALLQAPAPLLARQWRTMFHNDKFMAPIVVLFGGGVFSFLAQKTTSSRISTLYTASATLLALCIPYTYFVGEPINRRLQDKALAFAKVAITDAQVEVGVAREQTVHVLVDQWATMNLGRTVLTAVSALLATWAAVEGWNQW